MSNVHRNIDIDRYPKQGVHLGKKVRLCFNYNTQYTVIAECVRSDLESPYVAIFKTDDGRYILSTECKHELLI